jgi:hypothetical protein
MGSGLSLDSANILGDGLHEGSVGLRGAFAVEFNMGGFNVMAAPGEEFGIHPLLPLRLQDDASIEGDEREADPNDNPALASGVGIEMGLR